MIGKGGSVIKRISEMTACRIQLGDEADPYGTNERIVSISSGSVPSLVQV
jgi:hypothetical protein